MRTTIEKAAETYGVASWGSGYFDINRKGNLVVKPSESEEGVDLKDVVDDLTKRGLSARKASDKPCTASASAGIVRSGLK